MSKLFFSALLLSSLSAFSQSYKKIHDDAIVIDTHNDVLSEVIMKGLNIENDLTGKSYSDIARFKKGGVDIQVFSIFCDERFGKDTAYKYANIEIDSLYAIVGRHPDKMMIVTNPMQLQQAVKQKKLGCMMGVEGGHMIEDNLDYLDAFYKRGVRYMTLTWNNSTSWATSAMDETRKKDLQHKGLTQFGKEVVRRMNQLGMIVDISHVGEQTFWDAINTTTKPVIASHSCVYNLCPVFRNLKDDQIKAIGKNGGIIDLNFYSGFVDSNYEKNQKLFHANHKTEIDSLKALGKPGYEIDEWLAKTYRTEAAGLRPTLNQLLNHLDYIVRLIGVDHVGLGSDFDGISSSPQGLDDVTDFPNITKSLVERGYSKKDIEKILGGNFIRVFKANQTK
ncbi:MAG: dipeptidase [Flavisolibacter sp.]